MKSLRDEKMTYSKGTDGDNARSRVTASVGRVKIHASTEREQKMTLLEGLKHYPKAVWRSVFISTATIVEGYKISLLGSFYSFPAFQKKFGARLGNGTYNISAP
jgi:SP family general alpha glucoside:H+ symporter-like MFS transporter